MVNNFFPLVYLLTTVNNFLSSSIFIDHGEYLKSNAFFSFLLKMQECKCSLYSPPFLALQQQHTIKMKRKIVLVPSVYILLLLSMCFHSLQKNILYRINIYYHLFAIYAILIVSLPTLNICVIIA